MAHPPTLSALRSLVAARFPTAARRHGAGVPTGVPGLDEALGGGLPAGKLTELVSEGASSGGQLVLARLLQATRAARQRVALIDGADGFAPEAVATDALRHLVWVRAHNLDETLAAADVLVRDGNYAVVVLDLRGIAERVLRRTPSPSWHRLHRAAESRPAAMLVQTPFALVPAVPWRLILRAAPGLAERRRPQAEGAADLTVELVRSTGTAGGEGRMNYAVLRIADFALHALRRSEPALAGRPVALVAGEGRKAVLTEVSPEAAGIEPGFTVTLAMARCPGILLRTREPDAEVEAQRLLLAAAFTLSPRVEATAAGSCTVDLQGAQADRTEAAVRLRLAELAQAGLPARAGVGATPLLAGYAAQAAEPVLIVRDPGAFLRPLPLAVAEPTPAHAEILRGWGLKVLGDLTALTKADIGQRLGAEGVALWERAAGETTRVLRLVEPPKSFVAQWAYEPPVESMEPLLFKLRRVAERIAFELRAANFVAEALTLTLLLEDETDHRRNFRLPEPGADVESWLRVLQTHLDGLRTAARVTGVRLSAAPARPPLKQDGIFDTGLTDPQAFWENLARLGALVGDDRVGTPVLRDSHRPDAFVLEKPAETVPAPAPPLLHPPKGPVLRRFRPPRAVRVELAEARPIAVTGPVTGRLRAAAGPWRVSGEWWMPGSWAVETWQVELAAGGLYQLARTAEGWWLEGILD